MSKWALRGANNIEGQHSPGQTRGGRVARLIAAAALVCGLGLAMPAAQESIQPAIQPTFTPKRVMASGSAVTGLIGAVIGGLALKSSTSRASSGSRRRGAVVALVLGPIALVMGALVVASATGGLGTGNGVAGGVVAMIVGTASIALGGLAKSRSHRTA